MCQLSITKNLCEQKECIISYFRKRGEEVYSKVDAEIATNEYKKKTKALNKSLEHSYTLFCNNLLQKALKEQWNNEVVLKNLLMITYSYYVVMLDLRNSVWAYDYMTFSRRIGEIWEPFCKLCFYYSIKPLSLFIPPLFSDVKNLMIEEIESFIDRLSISNNEKEELKSYYKKVWSLVSSGEIKLELDLHFEQNNIFYNVDFKSGFGSNEKGNTNRLLLVATIFKNLKQNYENLLLVRQNEDSNNQYFMRLKKSGLWKVTCYEKTYKKIEHFTGFDLKTWINKNIDWENDLTHESIDHFKKNDLLKYLKW